MLAAARQKRGFGAPPAAFGGGHVPVAGAVSRV
jgi:hypothetical protein